MKRLALIVAAVITALTLLTLVLDLPEKIKGAYARITGTPPPVMIQALFANQEAITVSSVTEDASRGYMRFTWPSVYEIHNVTEKDVAIADLVNVLPEVQVGVHSLRLEVESDSDRIVTVYDSFENLISEEDAGTTEKLPLTVKAGDKKYIKVHGTYTVQNHGFTMFCDNKQGCYQLLGLALGVAPEEDGRVPCVIKSFETSTDYIGYKRSLSPQKAALLIPGCELNLQPLFDNMLKQE